MSLENGNKEFVSVLKDYYPKQLFVLIRFYLDSQRLMLMILSQLLSLTSSLFTAECLEIHEQPVVFMEGIGDLFPDM